MSTTDYDYEGDDSLSENIARLRDEADALGDMPNIPAELKNRLQSLQDQISDLYDIVAEDAAASVVAVEEVIVERPWLSVAVAFGLGCFFTALLRPAPRQSGFHW